MSLNPMGFGDPAITEPPWIADPSLMGLGASQRSGPQGPAQSIRSRCAAEVVCVMQSLRVSLACSTLPHEDQYTGSTRHPWGMCLCQTSAMRHGGGKTHVCTSTHMYAYTCTQKNKLNAHTQRLIISMCRPKNIPIEVRDVGYPI